MVLFISRISIAENETDAIDALLLHYDELYLLYDMDCISPTLQDAKNIDLYYYLHLLHCVQTR